MTHRQLPSTVLLVALLWATVAEAQHHTLLREDVHSVNPFVHGTARTEVTLQAALAAIGGASQTLMVPPGNWVIGADLTIPAHVALLVPAGATLTVTPGVTLTLDGPLNAPIMPIFTGAGRIVFGAGTPAVFARWFGRAQTQATLQAALTALDTVPQTLVVTPGTWTVSTSLTIPETVTLAPAPGAVFAVESGGTFTINGPLVAPSAQLFSGSGSVVLGPHIAEVVPYWFGAKCDDRTNDQAALRKTLITASASGKRELVLPAATCRISSALTVPADMGLRGRGWNASTIRVVGAIKGLIYDGANNTENPNVAFRNFSIRGDAAHTLDLFTIQGGAWNVSIEGVRLRGTAHHALVLDAVPNLSIRNCEIGEFGDSGIYTSGWTNGVEVRRCRFEDFGTASANGAIQIGQASGVWEIVGNVFESNTKQSRYALMLEGAHTLTFIHNYIERYSGPPIAARHVPSANVRIVNNYIHSFNPHKLDFATGNLAHGNIVVEDNSFAGVTDPSVIFHRGSAKSFRFLGNTADHTPAEWVSGYLNTARSVIHLEPGTAALFPNTLQVGDWLRRVGLSGNDLRIENQPSAGTVTISVAGQDVARFDRTESGLVTRFLLYDVNAGVLKRVKLGSADSCGEGLRCLAVDN
jgi:parallel beta helix pectate lyase-like protein